MPPAPSRNKQRCHFLGKADSCGPGQEGWCPHRGPPRPVYDQVLLRAGGVGTTPSGLFREPARLLGALGGAGGTTGGCPLIQVTASGCNPGAEGVRPPPLPERHPESRLPSGPKGTYLVGVWVWPQRAGVRAVSPMATRLGCSLWDPPASPELRGSDQLGLGERLRMADLRVQPRWSGRRSALGREEVRRVGVRARVWGTGSRVGFRGGLGWVRVALGAGVQGHLKAPCQPPWGRVSRASWQGLPVPASSRLDPGHTQQTTPLGQSPGGHQAPQ